MIKIQPIRFIKNTCNLFIQFILLSTGYIGPTAKFLGTLNVRKLDVRHDPRLRRASYLEWIPQLEITFSSNKYMKHVLSQYSNNNKITVTKDKKIDLLVYTVIFCIFGQANRNQHIHVQKQRCQISKNSTHKMFSNRLSYKNES